MSTQPIEKTKLSSSLSYQLIKDEQLANVVISSQVLAGSRILLSSYEQVVFSDCAFYACDFQGVTFDNCIFENCTFEFTHIKMCKFKNCNFENCKWAASSSVNSIYESCDLGERQFELGQSGRNQISFPEMSDCTTDIYIDLAMAS